MFIANDRPKGDGESMRDIVASEDKLVAGSFQTRECGLFAEHYASLQRDTGLTVPPRKTFDPSNARALLPYLSIIEIKEPKLALVRLVGTAIVNRTRIDNTGRNLLDMLPEQSRDWSWGHFKRITDTPCGSTFLSKEDYADVSLWIEVVSFPLADAEGLPRFILSLSVEVDRQQLALRGSQAMQIGELNSYRYIDIGDGI
ncbi:MAG: PAS domain-containing protein [Alphaproteobacteria bacterium]